MDELTESEALYILRKSYVMTTNHCLDEENIRLKKAIKTIIKINKGRNAKNKKLKTKLNQVKEVKTKLEVADYYGVNEALEDLERILKVNGNTKDNT